MKPLMSSAAAALLSAMLLAACDEPGEGIAISKPAAGEQLQNYSKEIRDPVSSSRHGPLFQRLCWNITRELCPPDISEKLETYGFKDGASGVALGEAFFAMAADGKDGAADRTSSDEDFVTAAYLAAFAREPDPQGFAHHVAFLTNGEANVRSALVLNFLMAPEFIAQQ